MTLHIHYPKTEHPLRETYTVVVDGMDLVPGGCDPHTPTPRQQIDALQRLVKIQKAEGWEMWVLFNGEPLEQVEHGGDFLGVRVFFSPTPPQRIPTLLECIRVLKKKDRDALLVTDDAEAETRAKKLDALTMRAQTLKKGHESLFTVPKRTQSRLMRHRTADQRKSTLDQGPDIRDMIDLVE
jgi:hypothetical protein